jgi:cysteine dioxygenase
MKCVAARNLIACDDTFTLMLLCWNPGKESPIHDHPCHGCWMRVTTGVVEETRYVIDVEANKLTETSKGAASPGDCIYIDDNVGLHKVRNPSTNVPACTLHLYSPPFARCNIWLDASAPADKVCNLLFQLVEVCIACNCSVANFVLAVVATCCHVPQ